MVIDHFAYRILIMNVSTILVDFSQCPSHIRYIRSSTPGAKDFSLLQRAKFTGGFFLLGRDSCLIVRCPMRSEDALLCMF